MTTALRLGHAVSVLRFEGKRPHSLITRKVSECMAGGNLALPVSSLLLYYPLLSLGGYPNVFYGRLGSTACPPVFLFSSKRGFQNWGSPFVQNDVSVEEREEWLNTLIARESPPLADTEAYLVVLRALAQSKLPDAPLRAERWLRRLEKAAESEPTLCSPTAECYQRVIEAWAMADHEDPRRQVVRAELWLRKHLDNPDESLQPDTACFNAFLDACSKGRGLKSRTKNLVAENAEKAQRTLEYMIKERQLNGADCKVSPDTASFNYVIRAWTRCRRRLDIADKAMESLRMLERYQNSVDSSVRPDSKSFAMVMDAIAAKAKIKAGICRNKKSARSDPNENGLSEIMLLKDTLSFMKESAEGDPSISPSAQTYNTLISAWANVSTIHEHAPFEAERVLQQMISLKDGGNDVAAPDVRSYMLVMRAWVNSGKPRSGRRVAWWLSKLWKDYDFEGREEQLCPTTEVYNIAIRSWANLGQPMEAEAILTEMTKLSGAGLSKKVAPNSESFAILIRAWLVVAERGSEKALRKAIEWLAVAADLEERNEKLSTSVDLYSGILAAARKCASQSPRVLELAVETFDRLRDSHHATGCLDYSRLLQVALLSLSRAENDRARELFIVQLAKDCCEEGLVSNSFLRALADGPVFADGWTIQESARLCNQLFPDWPLPESWTRNTTNSKQTGLIPKRSDLFRTRFRLSLHGHDPYKEH